MNRLFFSIGLIFALLFVSACTANTKQSDSESNVTELVEAEIIMPDEISLNQGNVLKVQLTQGEENVEDAEDVQFEIWQANDKENSKMIEAKHENDGIYSVKKTFQEDGIYYVQTHVTARDMHVMPKKQFVVGEVSEEELKALEEENNKQVESGGGNGKHH
jgi:hypothetical protein